MSVALATVLALLPACRTGDKGPVAEAWPPLETAEMGSMHNVSVSGELWLGGVPSADDLDLAKRRGILYLIDVCTPEERPGYDMQVACQELGISLFDAGIAAGIEAGEEPSDEVVDRVLVRLNHWKSDPRLIFCGTGGRSAMFFAIHRVVDQGVPLDQALLEARRAGMKPGAPADFVRRQTERLQS